MLAIFINTTANNVTDTIYTYYDAARNKYVLNGNELEYTPVKASESSSGMYNGGTYESKELTEKEYKELVQLFNAALADKKAQTNKNIKPNAVVEIKIGDEIKSFILQANAPINITINNYLKQLIKN